MKKVILSLLILCAMCVGVRAQTQTFSQFVGSLPTATLPLNSGDSLYVLQGGTSKRVNPQNLPCVLATSAVPGCAKPDNTTITVAGGILSTVSIPCAIATVVAVGCVKPDGTSITITGAGVISAVASGCSIATVSTVGCVKPDGTSITITGAGAISASATGIVGYINIKQPPFSAVGDGVADDTAAIQAAIDSAGQGQPNSTILCPDGIYKISQTLFLDPPGNLRGADGTHGRTFNGGITYNINDTVNSGGIAYISRVNGNIGNTPVSSPTQWRPYNFNAGTTYATNDIVSFNGVPWISLSNSNIGNTPSVSSTFWSLRWVNDSTQAFSYTFTGNAHLGSAQNNMGCVIKPTYNNGMWFAMGPGQGNVLANVELVGVGGGLTRGEYNTAGIGVGVSKDANRMLVDNVMVENVYTAAETGFNGDGQAAENTFRKFSASNCSTGIFIAQTQNFINSVIDPSVSCTNDFIANNGTGMFVEGGNVSLPNAVNSTFAVTGVTMVTSGSGNNFSYTVTATITTPDSHLNQCGTCLYNAWTVLLPDFGVVPLVPQSYNSGSHVMTFLIDQQYVNYYTFFGGLSKDLNVSSNFGVEMAAVTTMYAAERATTFNGGSFHVISTHLENPGACTQFLLNQSFFNSDSGVTLERNFANYTISQVNNANLAIKYCQAAFPFIRFGSGAGRLVMRDNRFTTENLRSPVIIDGTTGTPDCYIDSLGGVPAVRPPPPSGSAPEWGFAIGMCTWTPNDASPPFYPSFGFNPNILKNGLARAQRYFGFYPATDTFPRIGFEEYRQISGSLPALGSYPILNGDTTYSIVDTPPINSSVVGPAPPVKLAKSSHAFFSYGQNLTTTNVSGLSWSYLGQSWAVRASTNTLRIVFPGLGIILDNGSGPVKYVVVEVFPAISLDGGTTPGYFTVQNQNNNNIWLTGTQTVTYTGTLISQDPYIFSVNGTNVLLNSSIPFIVASSGTMGNNGAITALTALPVIYAKAYIYLPANAIVAGSAAGWYYATCSSTTACTVFNNTYVSGEPPIPASPTAFSTTGPGAFTGVTTSQASMSLPIPGNALGINSCIKLGLKYSVTVNANAKTLQATYGGTAIGADTPAATTLSSNGPISFCNRGVTNSQIGSNLAFGFASASYFNVATIDSTVVQTLNINLQHATATDNIILDSAQVEIVPYN